jgi:hypothetical protein
VESRAEGERRADGERMLLGVEELLEGRVEGLETEEKRQFGKDLEH